MNLLFTSAGRRDYLIGYFAEALGGFDSIHIGNCDPVCCAFALPGHRVQTPAIYSNEYIPFLLDYCQRWKIRAVIPLFDIDLPVLSAARSRFEELGTEVIVSDPVVIAVCNDKWETYSFLRRAELRVPVTWLSAGEARAAVDRGEACFPLMVKPRWGMGSIAMLEAGDARELEVFFAAVQRRIFDTYLRFESRADPGRCVLIQERMRGQEYGLDVLNDLRGQYLVTSVKRKLAMRSGETDIAMTEDNPLLSAIGERLARLLRHRGVLDVDLFFDGNRVEAAQCFCEITDQVVAPPSAGEQQVH